MSHTQQHSSTVQDPHGNMPMLRLGPAPEQASAVLILIHGRGATAESMVSLVEAMNLSNVAIIAPQAANHSWYPQSFLAPLAANQPGLDSALQKLESITTDLLARGINSQSIALLGFSQGACLASEFVARHPRHYGALMALTGGLIGPPGTPWRYNGSLIGTRVFLGTSNPDMHVPLSRVQETQRVLTGMGATVEMRRYPGMPHTINSDEIDACRVLMQAIRPNDRGS